MNDYIDSRLIESTYLFCVKRISDSEEAKDLSQDILCEALKAIKSGKSFVSFYSWYWKMARNKYADYVSHKKNTELPIDSAVGMAADMLCPIEKLINEEDIAVLNFSLSRLASMRREIIVRFYLKEQSIAEIAAALDIPEGTVKSRLFDAKKNLKERLENMNYVGKASYAPAEVNWFWGYSCRRAEKVMSQKIAQQIAVLCRAEAKEITDIADEMGVAVVYLEPIMEQMVEESLLTMSGKSKYLTNFCVFPRQVYLDATVAECKVFYENHFPERISSILSGLADKVKGLDFYGNDFEWDYLMWLMYVQAGYAMSYQGTQYYIQKYGDKYPNEAERSYRITMEYNLPEEQMDYSRFNERKSMGWSNLHQQFETAKYGRLEYINNFQWSPFPSEGEGMEKGRDKWIHGNNIGLLLELAENPKLALNSYEQEMVAEFIKNGLVKKEQDSFRVMLPIVDSKVALDIQCTINDALHQLSEEYARLVCEQVEAMLLPYVRKDLMSNFIHWDMGMFFQPTSYLFYYGLQESDYLAKPEDYSCSAAGLVIIKQ